MSESGSVSATARGARPTGPILVLVALVVLAMGLSCGHRFTNWDDEINLVENPDFNPPTVASVAKYWTEPFAHMYMPVTYTVWGVLSHIAYSPQRGLNPFPFHAFNLLLHASNVVLIFLLIRQLLGRDRAHMWAAAAGAALFAVHPQQVETVNWVTGMKDLLWGFFALVALLGYVLFAQSDARQPSAPRRWGPYVLASVALLLAFFAKPTSIITPALAVVIDRWIIGRSWRRIAWTAGPWFVLAVPGFIVGIAVHPSSRVPTIDAWLRPLVAMDTLAFYLRKVAWPMQFGIDYGRRPEIVVERGWVYLSWIIPAACGVVLWLMRRRVPAAIAGGLLTLVAVLPVSGLVPFNFQLISTVADRYFYIPMLGLAVIAAACLAKLPLKWWAAPAALVILALVVKSAAQSRHWRDGISLARHSIGINRHSVDAHANLAAALIDAGLPRQALAPAETAATLAPQNLRARWALATAQLHCGMNAQAEASMRDAIALDPNNSVGYAVLANFLGQQGRVEETIALSRQALQFNPNDALARLNLGEMLTKHGQLEEAANELTVAVDLAPDARSHASLGIALARLGKPDEARRHLREALRRDPKYAAAIEELAWLDKAYPATVPPVELPGTRLK